MNKARTEVPPSIEEAIANLSRISDGIFVRSVQANAKMRAMASDAIDIAANSNFRIAIASCLSCRRKLIARVQGGHAMIKMIASGVAYSSQLSTVAPYHCHKTQENANRTSGKIDLGHRTSKSPATGEDHASGIAIAST